MKRKILIGIVLLLVSSMVLGGCAAGVSQEEYDAVVAERDAAQAELASLQANATVAAAYVEFLSWHIGAAYSEVEKDAEYWAEFQAKVDALNDPELSDMFADMGEIYMPLLAQGLSEEEIMEMPEGEEIMQIHEDSCSHMVSKIMELLGVAQ